MDVFVLSIADGFGSVKCKMPFERLDDVLGAALSEIRKYLNQNGIKSETFPEIYAPGEEACIIRIYYKDKSFVAEKIWTYAMDGKQTIVDAIAHACKHLIVSIKRRIVYARAIQYSNGCTIIVATQDQLSGVIETFIHSQEENVHLVAKGKYSVYERFKSLINQG